MKFPRLFGSTSSPSVDRPAERPAPQPPPPTTTTRNETGVALHSGGNSRSVARANENFVDRSERVEARIDVQLWVNSEVIDSEARTANVSEDGMFVVTARPLPVGTVTRFHMVLPDRQEVAGFAEVAWIRPRFESAERPNGMGMRYAAVRENGKETLRDFVAQNLDSQSNAVARVREQEL